MGKINVDVVVLGKMLEGFDSKKVEKWDSELFEIKSPKRTFIFNGASDMEDWSYSDEAINEEIEKVSSNGLLVVLTNVPLEDDFFIRIIGPNRVCLSYSGLMDKLNFENIPLENLLFRTLYTITFLYKVFGNCTPSIQKAISFMHDDTRGCIFDMNGREQSDVKYSLDEPIICGACVTKLKENKIEDELISTVQKELKKIRKKSYFRLTAKVKRYPYLSLFVSSMLAILLGVISSILVNFIKN